MSSRKTTVFYALLIAVASLAVGMVLASRLERAYYDNNGSPLARACSRPLPTHLHAVLYDLCDSRPALEPAGLQAGPHESLRV